MQVHLLLTVSSRDKPGVVESVSSVIEASGASWLESRLAHLSGKFVGVIRVRAAENRAAELQQKLAALTTEGISVTIETPALKDESATASYNTLSFSAIGPDRTGIVKEIASALAVQGINVEELETNLSSMAWSGEPIFEARGQLSVPSHIDIRELYEKLDAIANELAIDFDLEEIETAHHA